MACKYCEERACFFVASGDEEPELYIEGSDLALDFEGVVEYVAICFCPMCGRDLIGDTNE